MHISTLPLIDKSFYQESHPLEEKDSPRVLNNESQSTPLTHSRINALKIGCATTLLALAVLAYSQSSSTPLSDSPDQKSPLSSIQKDAPLENTDYPSLTTKVYHFGSEAFSYVKAGGEHISNLYFGLCARAKALGIPGAELAENYPILFSTGAAAITTFGFYKGGRALGLFSKTQEKPELTKYNDYKALEKKHPGCLVLNNLPTPLQKWSLPLFRNTAIKKLGPQFSDAQKEELAKFEAWNEFKKWVLIRTEKPLVDKFDPTTTSPLIAKTFSKGFVKKVFTSFEEELKAKLNQINVDIAQFDQQFSKDDVTQQFVSHYSKITQVLNDEYGKLLKSQSALQGLVKTFNFDSFEKIVQPTEANEYYV